MFGRTVTEYRNVTSTFLDGDYIITPMGEGYVVAQQDYVDDSVGYYRTLEVLDVLKQERWHVCHQYVDSYNSGESNWFFPSFRL